MNLNTENSELRSIYKCPICKGIGYIEKWAEKKIKNKFRNIVCIILLFEMLF